MCDLTRQKHEFMQSIITSDKFCESYKKVIKDKNKKGEDVEESVLMLADLFKSPRGRVVGRMWMRGELTKEEAKEAMFMDLDNGADDIDFLKK